MRFKFISAVFLLGISAVGCNDHKPKACISTEKEQYKLYDTVTVTNCSENFTDLEWSYSNGAKTKSFVNPRIKLVETGNFSIQLTVTNDGFKTTSVAAKNLKVVN